MSKVAFKLYAAVTLILCSLAIFSCIPSAAIFAPFGIWLLFIFLKAVLQFLGMTAEPPKF